MTNKIFKQKDIYILEAIKFRAQKKLTEIQELSDFAGEILGVKGDSDWLCDYIYDLETTTQDLLNGLKIRLENKE